ncbi:MAG: glutaredoxin family protein [Pseudomonadota bacterium]
MTELLLYGSVGCHLCEQAEEVLKPVLTHINEQLVRGGMADAVVVLQLVEITDFPELLERYAVCIPVIKLTAGADELGWPFDEAQVFDFLVTQLS